MTNNLSTALGSHYRTAIIASEPAKAVTDLAGALRADPDLAEQARAQQTQLAAFARSMGGIDRMRQRDFAGATHLQGLTEALAQL